MTPSPDYSIPSNTLVAIWTEKSRNGVLQLSQPYFSIEEAASDALDGAEKAIDYRLIDLSGTDRTDEVMTAVVAECERLARQEHEDTGFSLEIRLPKWVEARLSPDETRRLAALEKRYPEAA